MIFVDTGAFCAFADQKDKYHQIAVRQFSLILNQRLPLITSNFVIDETYTWLRYHLGYDQAIKFLQTIRQAEQQKESSLEIITITREIEDKAMTILKKYNDQDLSFTDATSLAVIQRKKLKQAFSFDSHFYLLSIELIPGVVG
ncbi:MAG: PIN domain-containing protein [Candidatus Obscuribacterales bacterium]|nr:PIN domain-containing protein [Candidatus Obscuribacterales bacterium]